MFLLLVSISSVSAVATEVVLIDDIGSFTGAFLRIKSTENSVFIEDKIYPSEYLLDVGVVRFEIDTLLSEIDLNVKLIEEGEVIADFEAGPFKMNGSEILIDRRDKSEIVGIIRDVVVNNESVNELVNESVNGLENESVIIPGYDENSSGDSSNIFTGRAMFGDDDGSFNWGYFIVGMFVLFLFFAAFAFIIVRRRKSKQPEIIDEDEKELKDMETKVKDAADRISRIKEAKAKKDRIVAAKAKLAAEEEELKSLEGGNNNMSGGFRKNDNRRIVTPQEKILQRAVGEIEKMGFKGSSESSN